MWNKCKRSAYVSQRAVQGSEEQEEDNTVSTLKRSAKYKVPVFLRGENSHRYVILGWDRNYIAVSVVEKKNNSLSP